MLSRNGTNGPESKTKPMFRPVHQMAAPEAKSAVSDCAFCFCFRNDYDPRSYGNNSCQRHWYVVHCLTMCNSYYSIRRIIDISCITLFMISVVSEQLVVQMEQTVHCGRVSVGMCSNNNFSTKRPLISTFGTLFHLYTM